VDGRGGLVEQPHLFIAWDMDLFMDILTKGILKSNHYGPASS
jgi:hypothetical protein